MTEEFADVEWEKAPRRLRPITAKDWLKKYPDASMWRLAWSIWWRILVMTIATGGLTAFFWIAMGGGDG